jgi:hypothetical protein
MAALTPPSKHSRVMRINDRRRAMMELDKGINTALDQYRRDVTTVTWANDPQTKKKGRGACHVWIGPHRFPINETVKGQLFAKSLKVVKVCYDSQHRDGARRHGHLFCAVPELEPGSTQMTRQAITNAICRELKRDGLEVRYVAFRDEPNRHWNLNREA